MTTEWFTQKVTHFDDTNKDTYPQVSHTHFYAQIASEYVVKKEYVGQLQRYRHNNHYNKNNNIIFLLIEGESEASERWAGYEGYQWLQVQI